MKIAINKSCFNTDVSIVGKTKKGSDISSEKYKDILKRMINMIGEESDIKQIIETVGLLFKTD